MSATPLALKYCAELESLGNREAGAGCKAVNTAVQPFNLRRSFSAQGIKRSGANWLPRRRSLYREWFRRRATRMIKPNNNIAQCARNKWGTLIDNRIVGLSMSR